jgi:hypothetical protein
MENPTEKKSFPWGWVSRWVRRVSRSGIGGCGGDCYCCAASSSKNDV